MRYIELTDGAQHFGNFCFRGEGLSSFVIGSTCFKSSDKVVWRFRKDHSSRIFSLSSDAENTRKYIETVVRPLIGEIFVTVPNVVSFKANELQHLAKLPDLNGNAFSFSQLANCHSERSNFPPKFAKDLRISALQMPDLTSLPQVFGSAPTITVEIKPKQGFVPNIDVPYCSNCLLQLQKCRAGAYNQMYDFCPLDLFSGELGRMEKAIDALIDIPHNNLRIFSDGHLVFSKEKQIGRPALEKLIFPHKNGNVHDFVEVIVRLLSGNASKNGPFRLQTDSVLGKILEGQKLDKIGVVQAKNMYENLAENFKNRLENPFALMDPDVKIACPELVDYLVAATLKDCSLMISLKMVNDNYSFPDVIQLENSRAKFAYRVAVIDLDAKPARKLENNANRLMAGIELCDQFSRKPCL